MVNINVRIEKRDLWLIGVVLVFLVGVGIVVAYNSGANPSVFGHSSEEIIETPELPSCSNGQVLKMVSGSWQCGTDEVGYSPTWTPLSQTLGELPHSPGTRSYDLPASVRSAKEVLIHVSILSTKGQDQGWFFNIYTQEGSTRYIQKLDSYSYPASGYEITINSDNLWFPVTSNGKLYASNALDWGSNTYSHVGILGYR